MTELSDSEVFGQRELSDEEVFGAPARVPAMAAQNAEPDQSPAGDRLSEAIQIGALGKPEKDQTQVGPVEAGARGLGQTIAAPALHALSAAVEGSMTYPFVGMPLPAPERAAVDLYTEALKKVEENTAQTFAIKPTESVSPAAHSANVAGQVAGGVMGVLPVFAAGGAGLEAPADAFLSRAAHGIKSGLGLAYAEARNRFKEVKAAGGSDADAYKASLLTFGEDALMPALPFGIGKRGGVAAKAAGAAVGYGENLALNEATRRIENAVLPTNMAAPEPTTEERLIEAAPGIAFGLAGTGKPTVKAPAKEDVGAERIRALFGTKAPTSADVQDRLLHLQDRMDKTTSVDAKKIYKDRIDAILKQNEAETKAKAEADAAEQRAAALRFEADAVKDREAKAALLAAAEKLKPTPPPAAEPSKPDHEPLNTRAMSLEDATTELQRMRDIGKPDHVIEPQGKDKFKVIPKPIDPAVQEKVDAEGKAKEAARTQAQEEFSRRVNNGEPPENLEIVPHPTDEHGLVVKLKAQSVEQALAERPSPKARATVLRDKAGKAADLGLFDLRKEYLAQADALDPEGAVSAPGLAVGEGERADVSLGQPEPEPLPTTEGIEVGSLKPTAAGDITEPAGPQIEGKGELPQAKFVPGEEKVTLETPPPEALPAPTGFNVSPAGEVRPGTPEPRQRVPVDPEAVRQRHPGYPKLTPDEKAVVDAAGDRPATDDEHELVAALAGLAEHYPLSAQRLLNEHDAAGTTPTVDDITRQHELDLGGEGERPAAAPASPRAAGNAGKPQEPARAVPQHSQEGLTAQAELDLAKKRGTDEPWMQRWNGTAVADAVKLIGERVGSGVVEALRKSGRLVIVPDYQQLPPEVLKQMQASEGANGFFHRGVAYIVAGRTHPAEVFDTFLHEIGEHAGLKRLIGVEQWKALVEEVKAAGRLSEDELGRLPNGDPRIKLRRAFDETQRHYADLDVNSDDFGHELLAMAGELAPDTPLVRRIINALRNAIYRLAGRPVPITDEQIRQLLIRSAKALAKREQARMSEPSRARKRAVERDQGRRLLGKNQEVTDEELSRMTEEDVRAHNDFVEALPKFDEMASVAMAGAAKKGWYRGSTKAVNAIFGRNSPRFISLMAALSPRADVESNTLNAIRIWNAWDAQGRPTDPVALRSIIASNVRGESETSALGNWIDNAITALSTTDPTMTRLSGPKVESFRRDLMGDLGEVTNDSWMRKFFGGTLPIEGARFAGSKRGEHKSPGYIAGSTVTRRAAAHLTEVTGETWTPAEVQETVWSWTKALWELASKLHKSPVEIVEQGLLTDDMIATVPDFGTLLREKFNDYLTKEQRNRLAGFERAESREGAPQRPRGQASAADRANLLAAAARLAAQHPDGQDLRGLYRRRDVEGSRAGGLPQRRGVRGSGGVVAQPRQEAALVGLPSPVDVDGVKVSVTPSADARGIAEEYAARAGIPYDPVKTYAKVDPERAQRIVSAYEAMLDVSDPKATPEYRERVLRSYEAAAKETLAQYRAIVDAGYTFEFYKSDGKGGFIDPYTGAKGYPLPRLAIRDLDENRHLAVYPTADGYGTGPDGKSIPVTPERSARDGKLNPLLRDSGVRWNGEVAYVNDIFRAVHDFFGHFKEGVGFRADGEENAWRSHAAMYSAEALPAVTTETRGQNTWLNYGPHGDTNRTANMFDTVFAAQKIGLLPEWAYTEGRDDKPLARKRVDKTDSTEFRKWFGDSKIKNADGTPQVWYHGRAGDFDTFRPKRADSIFLTSDPDFAESFADMSAEWRHQHRVTDRKSEQNIMPLYVRAERPFDYENPEQATALADYLIEHHRDSVIDQITNEQELLGDVQRGSWPVLESKEAQEFIRANHDSYYVREGMEKNLAVYDPNQVKSVNNSGAFSREDNAVLARKRKQTDTPEFKRWFRDSKVVDERGEPLVVYRGAGDKNADIGIPSWFTDSTATADVYAGARNPVFRDQFYEITEYGPVKPGGHVQPVYLSLKNPKVSDFLEVAMANAGTVSRLTAEGYDGIVRVNERTGEKWFVPFRPEQVKSAIGNSGAFDENDPSILARKREPKMGEALRDGLLDERKTKIIGRGLIRASLAQLDNWTSRVASAFETASKTFDRRGEAQNLEAINDWEEHRYLRDPAYREFFDAMSDAFAERIEKVRAFGEGHLKDLIENYFPHMWENPDKAKAWYQDMLAKAPMEGSKAFLKHRKIPTLREGIAYGLKPVTTNPADMALLKLHQMDKYIAMHGMRRELEARGWLLDDPGTLLKGEKFRGYAKVDDASFRGKLVPAPIAVDLNRYLAPGLSRHKAWRGFRFGQNLLLSARLGFSGFHAGFTTMDTLLVHADLGARKLAGGDVVDGLAMLAKGVASPIMSPIAGRKLLKQFFGEQTADPETAAVLQALIEGGARGRMHPSDTLGSYAGFFKAIRQQHYGTAAMQFIPAVLEGGSRWIHHYLVPYQKMTARVLLMQHQLDKVAEQIGTHGYAETVAAMNKDALRQIAAQVVDVVDDRLGQFAYDNAFWNKTVKEVAQATIQSVGWNFGTFRTVALGAADVTKLVRPDAMAAPLKEGMEAGHMDRVSPRLSYLITMNVMVGMAGAALQYFLTGEGPDSIEDLYFPRTGRTAADGSPERLSLPSYAKDQWALAKHPFQTSGHKLHPTFGMLAEMIQNKDFYGAQIRNVDDPEGQQAIDTLKYVGKGFAPYAWQSSQRIKQSGESLPLEAASFVGVTAAPASATKSGFLEYVGEKSGARMPVGGRPAEDVERSHQIKDAAAALRRGENPDLSGFAPHDAKRILRESTMPYPEVQFERLGVKDKLLAWDHATPEERTKYRLAAHIYESVAKRLGDMPPDEREWVVERLKQVH